MPGTLQPLLVNTLGHSIGVLVFAVLLYLFLRDWRAAGSRRSLLPSVAAALALLWNLGSLVVMGLTHSAVQWSSEIVVALSFSVLSILPAVLLHISLGNEMPSIRLGGYAVSGVAVMLHLAEIFLPTKSSLHETALILISGGFGLVTVVIALLHARRPHGRAISRTLGTMAFFLFAMSFVHFASEHGPEMWSAEIAFHHAGIPLALLVLLQEYRFLLLDTFLRFLANGVLAAAVIMVAIALQERYGLLARANENSFVLALIILAAGATLILFGYLRAALQRLLTRLVFRRAPLEGTLSQIRAETIRANDLPGVLNLSGAVVSAYVGAERWEWRKATAGESHSEPALVSDFARWDGNWAEVVVPVWLSQDGCQLLLLGRRQGGRRYLSEELHSLSRMANVIEEEAERQRASEMRRLVSEAEYRALQAQINPHFLFNSLNALYGTIPRQAEGARRLVLNLSQLFRYFLRSDRTLIPLSEEMVIVRAYLEIEQLRLGDRLRVEVDVSPELLGAPVPVLSIQPLVENAIKHGVASRPGPGWVRITVRSTTGGMRIDVSDSGGDFNAEDRQGEGAGIGLANVRQRLRLCYGADADVYVRVEEGSTSVGFEVPVAGEVTGSSGESVGHGDEALPHGDGGGLGAVRDL
jgi:two-component system LytT family sensor kinase